MMRRERLKYRQGEDLLLCSANAPTLFASSQKIYGLVILVDPALAQWHLLGNTDLG